MNGISPAQRDELRSRIASAWALLRHPSTWDDGVAAKTSLFAFIDSLTATPNDLQEALGVEVPESPTPAETRCKNCGEPIVHRLMWMHVLGSGSWRIACAGRGHILATPASGSPRERLEEKH